MFRAASWSSVTLAVCTLLICGAKPRPPAPVPLESVPPANELQAALNKRADLSKGIDPRPLQEAVENLQDLFEVTIKINGKSFKKDLGIVDVEKFPVSLPVMFSASLKEIMQRISNQVHGVCRVSGDHLEIVPWTRAFPILPLIGAVYNGSRTNQASAPPAPEKAVSASETVDWQTALKKRVSLSKGIDPMPLQEAVENLQDQFRVPILIDTQAFRRDLSDDDVGGKQVKLQVMKDVRLATILRFLCDQVNGAYIANADHLEIVPATRVRPADRPLLPLVYANFKQKELAGVLEELSDSTDYNIVLDNRLLEDYGKMPVTANLKNVPVDTAVRVIAEGVGLKIVILDNLIFVTSVQPYLDMQKEKEARMAPGMA
jgi:hypothetical protein